MSEYPSALWIPADPSNYRRGPRAGYDRIVIHITSGHSRAEPVAEMWRTPHHGSSAHFVIDQDGSVIQAVSLADIAWHAHAAANHRSVGIEHCARSRHELGSSDPGMPASSAQYVASAKLIAWLCRRAGLTPDRTTIQGHAEIDTETTHADCPTGALDMDRLMDAVAEEWAAWANAS